MIIASTKMKPTVSLVVTDLDNTLYDWVTSFAAAFTQMVDVAAPILDVSREQLLDELQAVHRRFHNSEQPFALLETEIAQQRMGGLTREEQVSRLNDAFHAFNSTRKRTLSLYPGVFDTLRELNALGIAIVAHTEAMVTNAQFRLSKLGLAPLIRRLYALEHAGGPHPMPARLEPLNDVAEVRLLKQDERKPDPRVLFEICHDLQTPPDRTVYVGDSIPRDIGMAKAAGIWAAWAEYGTRYERRDWEVVVRVTHWTDDDFHRAQLASQRFGKIDPDVVLARLRLVDGRGGKWRMTKTACDAR
jgi:phosphoglycolate phosphatase